MARLYRMAALLVVLWFAPPLLAQAQTTSYETAYATLKAMLENKQAPNFSRAVFTVENAWYDNKLSQADFDQQIAQLASLCQQMVAKKQLQSYRTSRNWAVFMLLTQKVPENNATPYSYDFEDFTGNGNYAHTFVTRLLKDHKGNGCNSKLRGSSSSRKIGPVSDALSDA